MTKNILFTIGKVTGVHGLNGNLKIRSHAESVETFAKGRTVLLKSENSEDDETQAFVVDWAAPNKKGILLKLADVNDRDAAENQVGKDILIHRDQLPEPGEDEWFQDDLTGMAVVDTNAAAIGVIDQIFPAGPNDILVVRHDNGKSGERIETLIPMHRRFVRSVDMKNNIMTVHLPEGY